MATATLTAKAQALQLLSELPEDSTFDQILQELSFARMVEEGLDDLDQGRSLSHEEVRREAESWGK
jgi:predicted transcriptional regulator